MTTDLTLHRILKAPRSLVWDCWTKPELLVKWFCPRPHFLTEVAIDLEPGGKFDFTMNVDGNLNSYAHCVLHVIPMQRLVWTDLMMSGYRPAAKPFLGYSADPILKDHAPGTDYTAIARHKSQADAERHDKMGFTEGWGICADQLEDLAARMEAAG